MFESGPFTYFGSQALTTNIGIGKKKKRIFVYLIMHVHVNDIYVYFIYYILAESPTNGNPQNLGSIQSINLDSILRYTFIPDYTVRAVTEVFYVKVKRSLYLAAKRATLLERSQKDPLPSQDQFDDEVEKVRRIYILQ